MLIHDYELLLGPNPFERQPGEHGFESRSLGVYLN